MHGHVPDGVQESSRRRLRIPYLAPLAVGMALGVLAEARVAIPLWLCVAGFALCGVALAAALARGRWGAGVTLLVLVAGLVGAGLHHVCYRRAEHNHVALYTPSDETLVRLVGLVVTDPAPVVSDPGAFARWLPKQQGVRFLLESRQIMGRDGPIAVCGVVQVRINGTEVEVHAGQRLELFGRLYRFRPPGNPGQFDWARRARRQRVLVGLYCGTPELVRPTAYQHGGWWWRLRSGLRARSSQYLLDGVWPDDEHGTSLLEAMLLGQRSRVDRQLDEAFVRTGTAHLLSVSGIHVGALALFGWAVGRVLGLRYGLASAWVAALVIAYMVVAEPRAPIMRAGVLALLGCAAVAMRRPTTHANWLAAGALAILTVKPTEVFSAGFQLSFGVVLAVIYLTPRVRGVLLRPWARSFEIERLSVVPPDETPTERTSRLARGAVRWLVRGKLNWALAVALSAWMVGALLVAHHFGRWSPLGWLNSLLMLPLATMVMWIGFGKLLLSALLPSTSVVTGPLLATTTDWLAGLVSVLSKLPLCHVYSRPPPVWLVVGSCGLLAVWAAGLPRVSGRLLRLGAVSLAVSCVAWAAIPSGNRQALRVHQLAVGHGSAALIELPNGRNLLYDAGSLNSFNVAAGVIVPAIHELGVERIDAAIISHPNIDHYCAVLDIADRVSIERVLISPHFERFCGADDACGYLLDQLAGRGVAVEHLKAGDRLGNVGDVEIEVLWPPPDANLRLTANDTSIVLRITYGGRRVLLTGDVEQAAQRLLLANADLSADVLVAPHHGSVNPMTEPLLQAVDADWLIQSSGHRAGGANRLAPILPPGARLWVTDEVGCVSVEVRPEGVSVGPLRQGRE